MATKIFPSTNDVNGGVAGQGKTLTEANIKTLQALPYFDAPYVKSGAACTNGGGLILTVAAGVYCIDGRWVNKDAAENVTLNASSTNRVWLQLTKDGSGNVTGTQWVVNTSTAVPTDAVLVAEVVTGASTITTITQTYRGIIAPNREISRAAVASVAAGGQRDIVSLTVVGDGITPVQIKYTAASMTTASSNAIVLANLADGANITGTSYDYVTQNSITSVLGADCRGEATIAAWVGAKTFYANGRSATGGGAVNWSGGQWTIRGRWDPGATQGAG